MNRWTDCAATYYDEKGYDQWRALGKTIAAQGADPAFVADSLARFVGADKGKRMSVLIKLVRPSGSAAIGKRTEFPESLKKYAKAYEALVLTACEQEVEEKAQKEGPEAAGKLGDQLFARLQALLQAVAGASDFRHTGSQAEMVRAIDDRKHDLLAAMRKNAGKTSEKDEADALRHDYTRLVTELKSYGPLEAPRLEHLYKMLGKRERFLSGDLGDVMEEFDQLADLYAIWSGSFQKAAAIAQKSGLAEHLKYKPDIERYKKLRRANGQSD